MSNKNTEKNMKIWELYSHPIKAKDEEEAYDILCNRYLRAGWNNGHPLPFLDVFKKLFMVDKLSDGPVLATEIYKAKRNGANIDWENHSLVEMFNTVMNEDQKKYKEKSEAFKAKLEKYGWKKEIKEDGYYTDYTKDGCCISIYKNQDSFDIDSGFISTHCSYDNLILDSPRAVDAVFFIGTLRCYFDKEKAKVQEREKLKKELAEWHKNDK